MGMAQIEKDCARGDGYQKLVENWSKTGPKLARKPLDTMPELCYYTGMGD